MRPRISVVVVGYRRPALLEETVRSFLAKTRYPRDLLELILADDGSPRPMQETMRALPLDKWVLGRRNRGMGFNTNAGLRAASGSYVLQLQDDWRCEGPSDYLDAGLELLAERPDVELVRYRPLAEYVTAERHVTKLGRVAVVYDNFAPQGYSDMGRCSYSDNPHLKRSTLHDLLGLYREDLSMPATELEFCRRFGDLKTFRAAFIQGYEAFRHIGADASFNPVHRRARIRQQLLANPLTRWPFRAYLALRHRGRLPKAND